MLKRIFFISSILFAQAAFAQFSAFVVITPKNEAEYRFSIEIEAVPDRKNYSRIRVIGPIDGHRHAWLIVCKQYVNASGQNFRNVVWYSGKNKNIERVSRLRPKRNELQESGGEKYEYIEVKLPHDQMRRAYIYVDYPSEVNDGGYYYSIDLAYYLESEQGKKSSIRWEAQQP